MTTAARAKPSEGRRIEDLLSWYRNLQITVKLRVAFALFAGLNVVVGVSGLSTMSLLKNRLETAYQSDLPAVSAIKEAGIAQLKAVRVLLRIVMAVGDTDEIAKQNDELAKALANERTQLTFCANRVRVKEVERNLEAARKDLPQFEKLAKDIVAEAKAADVVGFRSSIQDIIPVSEKIQQSFDTISRVTEKQAATSEKVTAGLYWSALTTMVPMVVFSTFLAVVMGFLISGVIAAPLKRMVTALESVARGDLTQSLPINSTDETGQVARSLNRALASMRRTLMEVNSSAEQLSTTSRELAATSSTLAQGAIRQAAGIQETTASMEEISNMIRSNAASTERASVLGVSAREAAEKGDESAVNAISAMDAIKKSSSAISNVAEALTDLSFQSNLLAVNASIEAGRAGESGRSFAVVGEEMRRLAERSKESATEIGRLIDTSLARVNNGAEMVNHSGKSLGLILESSKNLSTIVDEIATSFRQQTEGVENVSRAMSEADAVVRELSQETQHLSHTARELAELATGLTDALHHFQFSGGMQVEEQCDDLTDSVQRMKGWFGSLVGKN